MSLMLRHVQHTARIDIIRRTSSKCYGVSHEVSEAIEWFLGSWLLMAVLFYRQLTIVTSETTAYFNNALVSVSVSVVVAFVGWGLTRYANGKI